MAIKSPGIDICTDSITLLPLTNAAGDVTNENINDEDCIDIHNLSVSLVQSKVEVFTKYSLDNRWDS